MRLSITNDELSRDLTTALEAGHEHHYKEFELHRLGLDELVSADERWLEVAEKAVQTKRLRVTALAPDFFKNEPCPHGRYTVEHSMAFERLFTIAKRLHCPALSLYSFQRDDDAAPDPEEEGEFAFPEYIVTALKTFVAQAGAAGLEVWLRPDDQTWAGVTPEAVALVQAIGEPNCGLDWDVAACMAAGDSTGLDHIAEVLPVLKAVHVADAVRRGLGAEYVSLGKGVISWEDILEQLYAGGFRGPLILAPRVTPKLRETRAAITVLARWIEAARMKAHTNKRGEKGSRHGDDKSDE